MGADIIMVGTPYRSCLSANIIRNNIWGIFSLKPDEKNRQKRPEYLTDEATEVRFRARDWGNEQVSET